MKKKLSIYSHQGSLEGLPAGLRSWMHGVGERNQQLQRAAAAIEALPRPLELSAVQDALRQEDATSRFADNDFRPVCDLCEEGQAWVLIIHEAVYDEHEMDVWICPQCIGELRAEVIKQENS